MLVFDFSQHIVNQIFLYKKNRPLEESGFKHLALTD